MNLFLLGVLVFFSSSSDAGDTDLCPSKAVEEYGEEYFKVQGDSCFLFVTHKKQHYEEAMIECMKEQGLLAMPKTEDINSFLLKELTETFKVNEPVWIGMSDSLKEGELRWEDGSEVEWENFDYYNHGLFGRFEDCIALNTQDKTWHDFPCWGLFGTGKRPFVCQYGKEPLEKAKPAEEE